MRLMRTIHQHVGSSTFAARRNKEIAPREIVIIVQQYDLGLGPAFIVVTSDGNVLQSVVFCRDELANEEVR